MEGKSIREKREEQRGTRAREGGKEGKMEINKGNNRNRGGHGRRKKARREKGKSIRKKREEQRRTRAREGGREGMRTEGERRDISDSDQEK
jgi:hypothetical protein